MNQTPVDVNTPGVRASRARHWVLVFASTLAIITYIDRVCISKAQVYVASDLHLDKQQMGLVFSAFLWAYAIFEIPGGWLGDKIGPRKVLMRVVLMWSFFTAATGCAWNWVSLLGARFLFGVGEAGCFPNLTKAFTNWLPRAERSRAVGLMWLFTRWGGAFTPLLVVWLLQHMGWRHTFFLFGTIGVVWAIWFFWWFRDDPAQHPSVNQAELDLLADRETSGSHVKVPWAQILTSRNVWLIWLQYFCFGYGWYFFITWFPTYLEEVRHVHSYKGAVLDGLPLFLGGIGAMVSGWFGGWLARNHFDIAKSRRRIGSCAFLAAALMFVLSPAINDAVLAVIVLSFASFLGDLALPIGWSSCIDIGGKYAGTVSGGMNMCAQIGGALVPVVTPYIVAHFDPTWRLTFWISAGAYVIAAACWMIVDPVTPLPQDFTDPGGFEVVPVVETQTQAAE